MQILICHVIGNLQISKLIISDNAERKARHTASVFT